MKPADDAPDDDAPRRHPGGRPRKELGADGLRVAAGLAAILATGDEVAQVLGLSRRTFDARLKEAGYAGFRAFSKKHRAPALVRLRLLQWQSAEAGDVVMAIWLGKQLLGQRDRVRREVTGADGQPITTAPAPEAFAAAATAVLRRKHGDAAPAAAPTRRRRAADPGLDPGDDA
jgi:hypothetical protein